MNVANLIGRLTKDVELRYTENKVAVGNLTLAVNRSFKNKEGNYDADFINCIAYKTQAETLNKYVKKGDKLGIEGRIQTRSYDSQDGLKKYVTEVIVDKIHFLENKKDEVTEKVENNSTNETPSNMRMNEIELTDDDLPF